jgi:hypothetical protein
MTNCKNCNKEIEDTKYGQFCVYSCYEKYSLVNKEPNCECTICKKKMYMKQFRLNKAKNGITCSRQCSSEMRKIFFVGENNHQKGLTGHLNSSFIGKETINNYGYILEYCPGHPRPADISIKGARVRQHRLVVERNSHLFDENCFEKINNWKVLKLEYDVHHINEIKTDNRIENLQILKRGEHSSLHIKTKTIIRNEKNGRIIGIVKDCELLESPEGINTTT